MANAEEPQTDRELLLKVSNEIRHLSDSIHELTIEVKDLSEKKFEGHEKRLLDIEKWKLKIEGAWRLMVTIGSIIAAVGVASIVAFFKYIFK